MLRVILKWEKQIGAETFAPVMRTIDVEWPGVERELTDGAALVGIEVLPPVPVVQAEAATPSGQGYAEWRETAVVPPNPEVCICAAVLTEDGRVVCGHRHHDALRSAGEAGYTPKDGEGGQGFVTTAGRYVDRREGRRLHEAAGLGSAAPGGYRGDLLFSEDLY